MSDFLDVDGLDETTRGALRRHVVALADTKRMMGIRYSDWLLGAPTIETGIAASSMAQDEWGHARLLYAMLKDLDEDPVPVEHDRADAEYANMSALDHPFPDWAAVVAAMVVVDPAITVAVGAFAEGTFEAATTRCPKMLAEEEFHRSLGDAWYRRLAASESAEARSLLDAATRSMLPVALAWVGADDAPLRALEAAGVVGGAAQRLAAYRDSVREILALAGVDVDAVEIPTAWDTQRGRAPGHPDADAGERARGDRNRALFVE